VYHLELRKFPHTVCRFNQSDAQVRAIVVPWVREEWIEEGERKWNSNEATLTVLEGPQLSMPELAMGRGWRNAQRRSEDVTERVLAAARKSGAAAGAGAVDQAGATGAVGVGAQAREGRPADEAAPTCAGAGGSAIASARELRVGHADEQLLADSLALELLALLDRGPVPLAEVWRVASERLGEAPLAESLALGDRAVRLLVARRLVVLRSDADDGGEAVGDDRIDALLRAPQSWAGRDDAPVAIARKA
jgi:hypothetical protein